MANERPATDGSRDLPGERSVNRIIVHAVINRNPAMTPADS